jgi:hypothetical protein
VRDGSVAAAAVPEVLARFHVAKFGRRVEAAQKPLARLAKRPFYGRGGHVRIPARGAAHAPVHEAVAPARPDVERLFELNQKRNVH